MLYELILINEIEQRAKIIFLSVYKIHHTEKYVFILCLKSSGSIRYFLCNLFSYDAFNWSKVTVKDFGFK